MGKRGIAVFGAIAAVALLAVPGASAATEVGSRCIANEKGLALTIIQDTKGTGSDALPLAVPDAGVLTEWKLTYGPQTSESFPTKLKVLRPIAGQAYEYLVIGDSAGTVKTGLNAFPTRIPVKAGDRLAIAPDGSSQTIFCATGRSGEDISFAEFGETPVGETQKFALMDDEIQVPITAIVEPDADGDGYGDETQDRCPANAAAFASCGAVSPVPISLDTTTVTKRGSVLVLVSASTETPVTVTGTANVAVRSKPAHSSALLKLPALTQTVKPGQIGRFSLKFSKSLKAALGALPAKKSLKLNIAVSATNATGEVFKADATVRLKGRGR